MPTSPIIRAAQAHARPGRILVSVKVIPANSAHSKGRMKVARCSEMYFATGIQPSKRAPGPPVMRIRKPRLTSPRVRPRKRRVIKGARPAKSSATSPA